MSGATTVTRSRQWFVVEWEEPDVLPPAADTDAVRSSESLLVAVTSAAVLAARPGDEERDASRAEAERLGRAWMQGEPSS
jgi:hypothetical protein